jgi:hypothetical protein
MFGSKTQCSASKDHSRPAEPDVRVLLCCVAALFALFRPGRLARAFAAGYYCSDERELMRECGVYLPR